VSKVIWQKAASPTCHPSRMLTDSSDLDSHLIYGSLDLHALAVQTESRSFEPFLHRLSVWTIHRQLVSWSLTSIFNTNMAISEKEGQGWRAIPTQWRKASDILTSTLAAFFFSSHPKKERDREAHLNYYASTYNRGRQLSHCKTKLNQI